jgi:hypothetical protein
MFGSLGASASGDRDPSKLASMIFFARHPERGGRKIDRSETAAAQEWISIRDTVVRPALERVGAAPPASGDVVVLRVERKPNWPQSLERGVATRKTAPFRPTGHPLDIVLSATAAAEGGYDTVNMYDRGILSWGMMQWTVHAGSLQQALAFIKRRLAEGGEAALWGQLFGDLDIVNVSGEPQLTHRGTPVVGQPALRQLFRGSPTRDQYDWDTARRWATAFARAGRNPTIQGLQREHARREVERVLGVDLARLHGSKYRRVRDYVGRSLKGTVLIFGMWTNNPRQSYRELARAVDRVASRYGSYDPAAWPADFPSVFADEFERVLRASRFDWWGDEFAAAAKRESRTAKLMKDFRRVSSGSP